jgi:hypothetical protein
MARPERFELPTLWFEARCSIQLSYGRVGAFYREVIWMEWQNIRGLRRRGDSPQHLG